MALIAAVPTARPQQWAQPVEGVTLGNCYKVSAELFRSEQPSAAELADLQRLGIRTVISLRHFHQDPEAFAKAGITCIRYRMDAGQVTLAQLREVLAMIRTAQKPVLIHCWHGSDRTGFVVAGYRIAFMGWSKAAAVEEFRLGGFGYHESIYPNIEQLLLGLDEAALRGPAGKAGTPALTEGK